MQCLVCSQGTVTSRSEGHTGRHPGLEPGRAAAWCFYVGFQGGVWPGVLLAFLSDAPAGGGEGRWDRVKLREVGPLPAWRSRGSRGEMGGGGGWLAWAGGLGPPRDRLGCCCSAVGASCLGKPSVLLASPPGPQASPQVCRLHPQARSHSGSSGPALTRRFPRAGSALSLVRVLTQHFTWQARASGCGQSPGTFFQLLSPLWGWRQQPPASIQVHPVPCRHGQPVLPGARVGIPALPPVVSTCIAPAGGPLLAFSREPLVWTPPSPRLHPEARGR